MTSAHKKKLALIQLHKEYQPQIMLNLLIERIPILTTTLLGFVLLTVPAIKLREEDFA